MSKITEFSTFSENKIDAKTIRAVGNKLGINWNKIPFSEFEAGYYVELEHGLQDPETNATNDDPVMTAKIAWVHLKEFSDYYTRLKKMEREGKEQKNREH